MNLSRSVSRSSQSTVGISLCLCEFIMAPLFLFDTRVCRSEILNRNHPLNELKVEGTNRTQRRRSAPRKRASRACRARRELVASYSLARVSVRTELSSSYRPPRNVNRGSGHQSKNDRSRSQRGRGPCHRLSVTRIPRKAEDYLPRMSAAVHVFH